MEQRIKLAKKIRGTVSVPGDKSISHRALMIAALAEGVSEVKGLSHAVDPNSTLKCLQALGVECIQDGDALKITGKGLRGLRQSKRALDAGNSGTTMRLLSGILAGQNFDSELTGDTSLSKRPMKRILEPLSQMGARIGTTEQFTAPLKIRGSYPLKPIEYAMPITSAQVKSAILFAGLNAQGATVVREKVLTRDHTERMLGLTTVHANDSFTVTVKGGIRIEAKKFFVPGDISSAAFLIAAGLIVHDSDLVIQNIGLNPTRTRVLDVFRSMGGAIEILDERVVAGEPIGDIRVRSSQLAGSLTLSGSLVAELIDEIPILAITVGCARGKFTLRDATDLRHKESDRISALVKNLRAMEVEVEEYPDGFAFENKNPLIGAKIDSIQDHRIAMAFGVAGLAASGETVIQDSECVDISFPGFWQILQKISH